MLKRISLVRRLPDLTREEFAARWLGEHVAIAQRLPGLRGYTVDIAEEPNGPFDGLATVRFESRAAAEAAFADPELAEGLRRTREGFAASVEIVWVEERVIVPYMGG
jgi:uncharacterized protein (TIGR02118 family)